VRVQQEPSQIFFGQKELADARARCALLYNVVRAAEQKYCRALLLAHIYLKLLQQARRNLRLAHQNTTTVYGATQLLSLKQSQRTVSIVFLDVHCSSLINVVHSGRRGLIVSYPLSLCYFIFFFCRQVSVS
jgi:hypothetical protein